MSGLPRLFQPKNKEQLLSMPAHPHLTGPWSPPVAFGVLHWFCWQMDHRSRRQWYILHATAGSRICCHQSHPLCISLPTEKQSQITLLQCHSSVWLTLLTALTGAPGRYRLGTGALPFAESWTQRLERMLLCQVKHFVSFTLPTSLHCRCPTGLEIRESGTRRTLGSSRKKPISTRQRRLWLQRTPWPRPSRTTRQTPPPHQTLVRT